MRDPVVPIHRGAARGERPPATPTELLVDIAKDDQLACAQLDVLVSAPVWGVVLQVVRDPAQSQQVTQEVFADLWWTAPRYDPVMGSALTWVLTLTHPSRGGPGPLAATAGAPTPTSPRC